MEWAQSKDIFNINTTQTWQNCQPSKENTQSFVILIRLWMALRSLQVLCKCNKKKSNLRDDFTSSNLVQNQQVKKSFCWSLHDRDDKDWTAAQRDIFNSLVPLAYTICSASLRWNWINLSIKSPIENKWIQIECEGRDWHCNLYTLCEYIFIFVCFAPRCRPYLRCPPGLQVLPGGRTMESLSPKNGNNFPIFSNLLVCFPLAGKQTSEAADGAER